MVGNKAGGLKAAETNKRKYGESFYSRIGKKGGQNGHEKGFGVNRALAHIAGSKGGRNSARGRSLASLTRSNSELGLSTKILYDAVMGIVLSLDSDEEMTLPPMRTAAQHFNFLEGYIKTSPALQEKRTRRCAMVLYEFWTHLGDTTTFSRACTEMKTMIRAAASRSAITWDMVSKWQDDGYKQSIRPKVATALKNFPR